MNHFFRKWGFYFYIYEAKKYSFDILKINHSFYLVVKNKSNIEEKFIVKIMRENEFCILETKIDSNSLYFLCKYEDISWKKILIDEDHSIFPILPKKDENKYKFLLDHDKKTLYIENKQYEDSGNFHVWIHIYPKNREYKIYIPSTPERHLTIPIIDDSLGIWIRDSKQDYESLFSQSLKQTQFKNILISNEKKIKMIPYPHVSYHPSKKNTLLFIDDRYDSILEYLFILFLYTVDESWNVTIFTLPRHISSYRKLCEKIGIQARFHTFPKRFQSIENYSRYLCDATFWKKIPEENVLLFQTDSMAFQKFLPEFFCYPYIGAYWIDSICFYKKIHIGNGGTSFRKARVMEEICEKYQNSKGVNEDIFFCEILTMENKHDCPLDIAKRFSFENEIFEDSCYSHQFYNQISGEEKMREFIEKRIDAIIV